MSQSSENGWMQWCSSWFQSIVPPAPPLDNLKIEAKTEETPLVVNIYGSSVGPRGVVDATSILQAKSSLRPTPPPYRPPTLVSTILRGRAALRPMVPTPKTISVEELAIKELIATRNNLRPIPPHRRQKTTLVQVEG